LFLKHRPASQVYEAYRWDTRASLLAGIYVGAISPFIGRIARGDLHCTPFQLSLIAAAPFIGNLFTPVWARQMEGKAKMPFAVWSWMIGRGILLFLAVVSRSWPFVLIVSLSSMILTINVPAYAAMMKDVYPDRLRGRLMGYTRVSLQVAGLATALVAGRALDRFGYRVLFPIGAAAGIFGAWAFSRIPLPRREDDGVPPSSRLRDTFSILRADRRYRWFMISIFLYGFGNLMVQPVYILFQVDRLRITNTQVANLANVQSVAAVITFFYAGRFLDRKGSLLTTFVSILAVCAINLSYLLAFRVEHLYLAAVAGGVANAGIELAYINAILLFADRGRIPQYQAVHSSLLGVRGAIAPFCGSALMYVLGMRGTFALSLGMIVMGAAIFHREFRGVFGGDERSLFRFPDPEAEKTRIEAY
jgi:hypothetical protein